MAWFKDEKIALLEKTIQSLKDVIEGQQEIIKAYQEKDRFLMEKFSGGAQPYIVQMPPEVAIPEEDFEAFTAGTISDEKEEEDGQ